MISQADVRRGKCFLSAGAKPQVLRVQAVQDGLVRFEVLHAVGRSSRAARGEAPTAEFVTGLVREVGCDFRPGDAERVHV